MREEFVMIPVLLLHLHPNQGIGGCDLHEFKCLTEVNVLQPKQTLRAVTHKVVSYASTEPKLQNENNWVFVLLVNVLGFRRLCGYFVISALPLLGLAAWKMGKVDVVSLDKVEDPLHARL
mgnify:CR=1 FL=1